MTDNTKLSEDAIDEGKESANWKHQNRVMLAMLLTQIDENCDEGDYFDLEKSIDLTLDAVHQKLIETAKYAMANGYIDAPYQIGEDSGAIGLNKKGKQYLIDYHQIG